MSDAALSELLATVDSLLVRWYTHDNKIALTDQTGMGKLGDLTSSRYYVVS